MTARKLLLALLSLAPLAASDLVIRYDEPATDWTEALPVGNGRLGDIGIHVLDLPFWALGLKHPTSVEAEGPPVNDDQVMASDRKAEFRRIAQSIHPTRRSISAALRGPPR